MFDSGSDTHKPLQYSTDAVDPADTTDPNRYEHETYDTA
jgi:hypothetical protein